MDLTNAESSDFLQAALNDIATPDEINSLTTSEGQISQDGINRVKRALFALAYGDEGLIAVSPEDNVRGVTNALLTAAPSIVKIQAGMNDGVLHKYNLKAIVDAVKKLSALRNEGKPVSKYLQEQSLFGENKPKSLIDLIKRAREANLFAQEQPAPQKTATKESPKTQTESEEKDDWLKRHVIIAGMSNGTKFSKQGTVDTRIENFVDDKDLTPQQKLLKSFGEKLGTKVIFFRNKDGRFHGVRKNGATYLNVNLKMPLGKVFLHESMHWFKKHNPKLYRQLVKSAGKNRSLVERVVLEEREGKIKYSMGRSKKKARLVKRLDRKARQAPRQIRQSLRQGNEFR